MLGPRSALLLSMSDGTHKDVISYILEPHAFHVFDCSSSLYDYASDQCLSVWRAAPVMIYSGILLVEIFVTDKRADGNRRCSKRSLRIKQAVEEKYLGNPIHHHLVSRSTTKTSRK